MSQRSPIPYFLIGWLLLSCVGAAWTLTSLDSCMKWGYSGVECLQQTMGE